MFSSCHAHYFGYEGKRYRILENYQLGKERRGVKAVHVSGSQIPDDIFRMTGLLYLKLSNNGIDSLSKDICNLTTLKSLVIHKNTGITLPDCLFQMSGLEVLAITGCNLQSLPASVKEMKNLKRLVIIGNDIGMVELQELQEDLPNTKIIYVFD